MTINQRPADYSPAFGELLYAVSGCDPQLRIDVTVVDRRTGVTAGRKRLYGQGSYNFNISGYVRRLFGFVPPSAQATPEFVVRPERMARVGVTVGAQDAGDVLITAAREAVGSLVRLSAARALRMLDRDGCDELSFIARGERLTSRFRFSEGGEEFILEGKPLEAGSGHVSLPVCMEALGGMLAAAGRKAEEFGRLQVTVAANGAQIASQEYLLAERQAGAVRLAWVNAFGAVDCYAFPAVVQRQLAVGREEGISQSGEHCLYDAVADRTTEVISELETPEGIAWLLDVAASPVVWELGAHGARRVEVTASHTIYNEGWPGRVEIGFRPAANPLFQGLL